MNEGAFRCAVGNGYLDIIDRLLTLKGDRRIDVHIANEEMFRRLAGTCNLDVVDRLFKLTYARRYTLRIIHDSYRYHHVMIHKLYIKAWLRRRVVAKRITRYAQAIKDKAAMLTQLELTPPHTHHSLFPGGQQYHQGCESFYDETR
jgi:hypothetical protein